MPQLFQLKTDFLPSKMKMKINTVYLYLANKLLDYFFHATENHSKALCLLNNESQFADVAYAIAIYTKNQML